MAKKTASELKAEGADLGALIATARKRPLNFALLIGKEGIVLEAHPTKGADVMRRLAKANGGGTRGTQGVMNVSGKVIELTAEEDDFPTTLAKMAKRHLKERGLAFKVVIVLPSGERLGEDDDEEDGEEEVGETDDSAEAAPPATAPEAPPAGDAPPAPEAAPATEDRKAELTARIKALVPEVKKLAEQKAPGVDRLGKGLQAAGAELAKQAYDRVAQLLAAIEKGIAEAKAAVTPEVDSEALRKQLKSEYAEMADGLEDLKHRAAKGVAGKADQLSKMFAGLVDGDDLKKAGAVLSLVRTFVNSELAKLSENTGGLMDRLGAAVSEAKDGLSDLVEKGLEAADDFKDSLTEDGRKRLELQALGYSDDEQDAIVASLATNPDAVLEAKQKRVDEAKLDPKQAEALKKMAASDPKAFAAAMASLKAMDAGGVLDTSPAAMQKSLEAFEAARKKMTDALAAKKAAETKIATATVDIGLKGIALGVQRGLAAAAAKAVADFQAGLSDPATMSEADRAAAVAESTRLINANEEAKKALAAAEKAQADAIAARDAGIAAKAKAEMDAAAAKGPMEAAEASNDALESKQAMLEAVTVGRLSPGAKPAFKDEDKAAFLAAFAKDGKLAGSAMDIAARSENPSAVAQNVGMVAGKLNDGFADASGNKLDLPKEQLRAMSQNALQMGALQGEEYFKGFDAYLKTGAQLKPDPYGGLEPPIEGDPKAENQRQNKIALARSGAMGAAAVQPDGKVDFGSDAARAAMDHMMFHPGSLTNFTPQMTQKMAETKALFADGTKGPKAEAVIAGTKLPAPGAAGALNSKKIIAGTMGKKPAEVTDNDAKGAVLSAMMTPLSQGPVGSCFSTAPVRAIRETDPLRAMGEYSKIATTGMFKAKNGATYPANLTPPLGENPLMRSWEYSVATAAAEEQTSIERGKLRNGLTHASNKAFNLGAIEGIVGAGAWANTNDPVTGDIIPGVQEKINTAIATQLKFEYNAGPGIGAPTAGGGDGSSTDGGYKILYGGKALESEAAFLAAVETIALGAAGVAAGSVQEGQIKTLIQGANFKAAVLAAYTAPTSPWALPTGGFEMQTAKVLDGGNPARSPLIGKKPPPAPPAPAQTDTQRNVDVLGAILTSHKTMTGDMGPMGTSGANAAHAFNTLPNHPSLDKIKDPNSAAKIQTELVAPAQAMAAKVMSVEETQMLYDKQLNAILAKAPNSDRAGLVKALANKPTTAMKPAALAAKVQSEVTAYLAADAQRRADDYVKEREPTADAPRKAVILAYFQNAVKDELKGDVAATVASAFAMPEVVVADTNWGTSQDQTYFVVAGDPITGELIFWKKEVISGKMTPLGKNWTEGPWMTVK